MDITSPQNPRIKHLVRLRDEKKTRKAEGLMLVEGWDEIQLALAAGHAPRTLLTSPELASRAWTFPARSSRNFPTAKTPMAGWRSFPFPLQHWTLSRFKSTPR